MIQFFYFKLLLRCPAKCTNPCINYYVKRQNTILYSDVDELWISQSLCEICNESLCGESLINLIYIVPNWKMENNRQFKKSIFHMDICRPPSCTALCRSNLHRSVHFFYVGHIFKQSSDYVACVYMYIAMSSGLSSWHRDWRVDILFPLMLSALMTHMTHEFSTLGIAYGEFLTFIYHLLSESCAWITIMGAIHFVEAAETDLATCTDYSYIWQINDSMNSKPTLYFVKTNIRIRLGLKCL